MSFFAFFRFWYNFNSTLQHEEETRENGEEKSIIITRNTTSQRNKYFWAKLVSKHHFIDNSAILEKSNKDGIVTASLEATGK